MTQALEQLIEQLQPGEPIQHERISVVPIAVPDSVAAAGPDYLTLEEATAENLVDVEEKDASGSVPEMLVRNRSRRPLFIPDGATLVGSKQNRVVNVSVLLAGKSVTLIPVSCVESGRWHRTSGK